MQWVVEILNGIHTKTVKWIQLPIKNLVRKTDLIKQKITLCLWVETKDAKAVVDYYLSIFQEGKLKEHRKYKNPPEAGGGDFETAIMEINEIEFNILAAGPFFKFNESVSL